MELTLPAIFGERLGGLLLAQWLGLIVCTGLGLVLGMFGASLLKRGVEHVVARTPFAWDDKVGPAIHTPARLGCTLLATFLLFRTLSLPDELLESLGKVTRAGMIAATVWGMIRALYAVAERVADASLTRDTMDTERLARARSLRTQAILATRVLSVLLFLIGSALVALQFSVVRSVGMSLLASAGVAGVVLGFAAQKSLGALLAGIQISLSQPIRIGDSVVLHGEHGTIEDIGLTYVTVRVWDERRLFVPTTRFLEEPFQNWSRTRLGLLGTVFLKVDFDLPIELLRAEFEKRIVDEVMWDGRVKGLHVTDAGEHAIEVRLLMSARDPGALWELRTAVREKMVHWLQTYERGAHLPRTRVVLTGELAAEAAGHEGGGGGKARRLHGNG